MLTEFKEATIQWVKTNGSSRFERLGDSVVKVDEWKLRRRDFIISRVVNTRDRHSKKKQCYLAPENSENGRVGLDMAHAAVYDVFSRLKSQQSRET